METVSQEKVLVEDRPTFQKIQEIIANLTAIRAISDLLCAAADSVNQGQHEFHEETLPEIGVHLDWLATKALVILGHEPPRGQEARGGEREG